MSKAPEQNVLQSENPDFLTSQIITYIGNKRALIGDIEKELISCKKELGKERCTCVDLFSGSGIASRMMKKHADVLIANDLEQYSYVLNSCYLTNTCDFDRKAYDAFKADIDREMSMRFEAGGALKDARPIEGIIAQNYAPKDDEHIQKGERAFYTRENALRIDTYRALIESVVTDRSMRRFFLAPLITEASIHTNTSGVFKGFYKDTKTGLGCFGGSGRNALSRICGQITLPEPVLSAFDSDVRLFREDAVMLSGMLGNIDIAYLDPPYNQHPYGSNYFMLNLILNNRIDCPVSRVSGILSNWNRSSFNKERYALASLEQIIRQLDAKFIIVSYNSEGFISFDEMQQMLGRYGTVKTTALNYNTFRGSRNLKNRPIHVNEYLFTLRKN
ncbi:MAG: DNA adenine methylase [Treponema sp.]|nr:DNA adenine methylase [Candidatus Treponema caballi]